MQGYILLCADGESHTEEAVRWSLDLAIKLGLSLKAVHVRDPHLKSFYNDIYAQGREEYLAHVQKGIEERADQVGAAFEASVKERLGRDDKPELDWSYDVLDGNPVKRFAELLDQGDAALVVLGRCFYSRHDAFRSRDLGERLEAGGCRVPMLIVPTTETA